MALYHFKCECGNEFRRIIDKGEEIVGICPECKSNKTERVAQPINVQMKDVLDNGRMTKRLERFTNAQDLYKNRK